jgi:hypothetical protein
MDFHPTFHLKCYRMQRQNTSLSRSFVIVLAAVHRYRTVDRLSQTSPVQRQVLILHC